MQGFALRIALVAVLALACAAPALAQEPAPADTTVSFTLGRVLRLIPDKQDRIGIRSTCSETGGCTIDYALHRGTALLGGNQFMLLGNTVETDYITLAHKVALALHKRRMLVTVTAKVKDPAGNEATFTKQVTLGPKKKTRR